MSKYEVHRIDRTTIGNVTVSTVDCFSGFTEARVAETMILLDDGEMPDGLEDQDGERCGLSEGKAQHAKWVAKVQEAQAKS